MDLKNGMIFSHENINKVWIPYKKEGFVTLYTEERNQKTDVVELTVEEVITKATETIEEYQMRNIMAD